MADPPKAMIVTIIVIAKTYGGKPAWLLFGVGVEVGLVVDDELGLGVDVGVEVVGVGLGLEV
jgi:hypothetical protein